MNINLGDPVTQASMLSIIVNVAAIMIVTIAIYESVRKHHTKTETQLSRQKESAAQILIKTIQKSENEKQTLAPKVLRQRLEPYKMVGYALLLLGLTALAFSIIYTFSILAFMGLGFIFLGVFLLLFVRPHMYVKRDLLNATVMPSLITIDRILRDLNYLENGIYIPPRSLEGVKEGVVFIPASKEIAAPTPHGVSQERVLINPSGISIVPPGLGLVSLFEKELRTDLFKTDLEYLKINLPKLLIEDLELLKDFEMSVEGNLVHVRMAGPFCANLCREVRKLTNFCSRIGCPLCSAIALALAKTTGKAVTIEKSEFHPDETVETRYRIIEG